MSAADRQIATSVAQELRNQARQASWASDPAGWAHDVLGVHMWSKQKEISHSVVDNKRTVVASCHGTGKALALDEPVHTPHGLVPMGDIRPGMQVLGADGEPTTVVAVTGAHRAESFRVRLERGADTEEITASGEHLWPVLTGDNMQVIEAESVRAGVPVTTGLWSHLAKTRSTYELAHLQGLAVVPGRIPQDPSVGDPGWTVVSVEPVGEQAVQCIQVAAEDHVFLCGTNGIQTHNSMIASVLACWWISTKPIGEAVVVSCYTDDTEVLTRDGWKLFKDVKTGPSGDEFATRNPKNKQFEWQHAFRYWEEPWDGEVVDVKGRSTDLRVTPNHRMLLQWSEYNEGVKKTGEIFKRSDAIGKRGAEIPALSVWESETPETVTFGRHTWDVLDFAAFLGAWLAEGSLGPRREYVKKGGYGGSIEGDVSKYGGLIVLTQLEHTKGYLPYRELLSKMIGKEPPRIADKDWSFACSELYDYLEPLGKSYEKYIPQEVKDWGPAALERFLEFYLLGDGWFQKSQGKRAAEGYGSWRACTVSKRLAGDLQEIAQKVGKYATIREREPRDGGTFEGGRQILAENCRVGYYLTFGDSKTRTIKTSRSHYKGNVYCVSVPNEVLYVRRPGVLTSAVWCGNTAPTYPQVNKILWEEIRKHHASAKRRGTPMVGYVTQGDEWKTQDGQILAFGRKPATGDRHGFQGIHRKYVLAVGDEACGLPEEIWTGIEAITTGDSCRMLYIGNPDDRVTEFGKAFLDPASASDWNRISVPASSTPNFTGEEVPPLLNEVLVSRAWAAERLRNWGPEDPRYISKVEAKFPEQSKSSLFPPSVIASSLEDAPPQPTGPVIRLGVDVARFGTDANVVVSHAGVTAKVEDTWSGTDTVSSAHKVLKIAEDLKTQLKASWVEIRVDAVGLGAGVVDTLNARAALLAEPWFSVYEMHGSASPPTDVGGSVHGYGNARAYWFDQLRQQMVNRQVQIEGGRFEQTIKDDLGIVFYEFRAGKLYIISKEQMRRDHGRSPDFADALAYATAPVADGLPLGSTVSDSAEDLASDLEDMMDLGEMSIGPF